MESSSFLNHFRSKGKSNPSSTVPKRSSISFSKASKDSSSASSVSSDNLTCDNNNNNNINLSLDKKVKEDERINEEFKCYLQAQVVDIERIRLIAWKGVPSKYRAPIWRLFLDYEPVNATTRAPALEHKRADYFDCAERVFSQTHLWTNAQKQTESQILKDLPRTHVALLRDERVKLIFERVLFVWSVRHPASGYVQGMNDLLQPFFYVFLADKKGGRLEEVEKLINLDEFNEDELREVEADCFWCFSKLLDGIQDLYTKDQPGLYKMLESLEKVIERVDPKMAAALKREEIQYQEFAFRWMNCLLVREFSMKLVLRLWDSYMSSHQKIATIHVFVCAAMMMLLQPKISGLNHAEFVMKIQEITPDSWSEEDMEMIVAQSYVYEKMFLSSSHLKSQSMPNMIRSSSS